MVGWLRDRPWLGAWLAILPLGILRAGTIAENDTLWQVRTGLVELQTGQLIRQDTFAWTTAGRPWVQNSWAYNVLDGLAYRAGGLAGVSLLSLAVFMGLVWAMLTLARRLDARPAHMVLAIMFLAPLFLPLINARPHLVDQLALVVAVLLARDLTDAARPAVTLGVLAAVTVAWANLHPATPVLVAALGLTAAFYAARRRWQGAGRLAAAAAVVAATTAINPYGLAVVTQGARIAAQAAGNIIEWSRPSPSNPSHMLLLALGAIGTYAAARRREPLIAVTIGLTTVLYAVQGLRFGPFALVLATPLLAAELAPRLEWIYRRYRPVLFAGLVAFSLVAAPSLTHLGRLFPSTFPVALVDALPAGCRLINPIDFSGLVILRRPDVLVSTDGRVELHPMPDLYGPEYWKTDREPLRTWLTSADCVLVYQDTRAARWLATSPQWHESGRDARAVTYSRKRG